MFHELMLDEIAKMVGSRALNSRRELVRGVSINSLRTKPGDVFFALRGQHTDGHRYVTDALQRGAVAVVVEKSQSIPGEILVSDTLFALGELARNYRGRFRVKTIGITGTNGKTTVRNLVAAILGRHSNVLYTNKNYNSLIGLPLTVLRLSGVEDYLVVEMGTSAPGEIKRLCDIAQPDVGMVTNVGPGHLEGLNSVDGVRKEKLSLIESLPAEGIAVVGEGVNISGRNNIIEFSTHMLEALQITEHGSYFTYKNNAFFTSLLGIGNAYNCLAAICLTSALGIDYETQRVAIEEAQPEPGRMKPIHMNGLLVIDDTYNANPVSMQAAIDFVAQLRRKKILVLGDMLELGEETEHLHRDIGVYAQNHADLLVTFGHASRHYDGEHFSEEHKLLLYLKEKIAGDEVVLFKASRGLHFEKFVNGLARLLR